MENKKQEKSQYPEAVVGALILNQDDLMLLAKSQKWKGKYTVFGGHVEIGETLEDAIMREVKEETGLDISLEKKIGFSDSVFEEDFKEEKHFVFLDFLCRFDGEKDEVQLDEREYMKDEYVWVDPEGALKMDIAGGTRGLIERYLEEKKREEYLSGWQRCLADFENYKKRQLESQRFSEQFAKERIIMEILPVVDNFEASLLHVPEKEKESGWVVGINHIKSQIENILKENDVVEIGTKVGDDFDPEIHEAIEHDESAEENDTKNKISKVVQKGYKIGERVIRPARVVVG